jgi:hypothetical protein
MARVFTIKAVELPEAGEEGTPLSCKLGADFYP